MVGDGAPCACGRRFRRLEAIQGRITDSILRPDGSHVPPFSVTSVIREIPGVRRFQIVQDRLVKMLAEVTGMQLYCMQLARLEESGRLSDTIAGLAKLNNTRKARAVIAEARDLLGGNGVLLENHVIRHMGDIEVIHTYEGTETMQTLIVGRDITGVGAFA